MTLTETRPTTGQEQNSRHFDVIIVGAGISGVGTAYHLTQQCPDFSRFYLHVPVSFCIRLL